MKVIKWWEVCPRRGKVFSKQTQTSQSISYQLNWKKWEKSFSSVHWNWEDSLASIWHSLEVRRSGDQGKSLVRTKSSKQVFPIISSRTQFFGIWLLNYGLLILQFGLRWTMLSSRCCDLYIWYQFLFYFCGCGAGYHVLRTNGCDSPQLPVISTISEPSLWNLDAKMPVSNQLDYDLGYFWTITLES